MRAKYQDYSECLAYCRSIIAAMEKQQNIVLIYIIM